MQLMTLKQVADMTKMTYGYLYSNKVHLGFFRPANKGKWLVTQKILEEKMKELNNASRLASFKEVKKCQSKKEVKSGISTFKRQVAEELGVLLKRKAKRKHKSITTN